MDYSVITSYQSSGMWGYPTPSDVKLSMLFP